MQKEELFEAAKMTIINAEEEKAMDLIREAQENGIDLLELLVCGFSAGNEELGLQFNRGRLSLPELIYSAEVMRNVTEEVLNGLDYNRKDPESRFRGTVVIATVEGDIHDIGKGIVASTLRTAGFRVIDLGSEVPASRIVEEAKKYDADIIGTSALLTSTLQEQKKLEKLLQEQGCRHQFLTMVGGAPCTPRWARKIGADGYSEDAVDAVRVALYLMDKKQEGEKSGTDPENQ